MSNVFCPYCDCDQEINHDDGYGYEEGEVYEQECINCSKTFKFTTEISFDYSVYCKSEDDHVLSASEWFPNLYSCEKCDHYEVIK